MLLRRLSRNHILPYRHPQKRSDISANASTRSLHHSASQQHPQADDSEMPSHHLRPIATKKKPAKIPNPAHAIAVPLFQPSMPPADESDSGGVRLPREEPAFTNKMAKNLQRTIVSKHPCPYSDTLVPNVFKTC